MKVKIICILVMTLLITMATIPLVSSKNTEQELENTMPSMVDQQQPNNSEIHWLPPNQPNWQKFIHHGKVLEKVELFFGCWYGGSQDVTLSIWDTYGGPAITSVTYPASAFPLDVQTWFLFDFPDVNIPPLQPYWIVVEFGEGSEYAWSGSHNNPYLSGDSSHTDGDWDYAFKTIVDVVTYQGYPQVLDQNQMNCDDCRFLPNYGWQQFVPKAKKLYYVDVCVGHFYGGSPDITLSIEQPLGNQLTTITLPVTAIPDHYCDWVRFDFPDIYTTPNTIYYIVMEYPLGGEYAWCGAYGNPYSPGTSDFDPDWDYTFQTYVDQVSHNNKVRENYPEFGEMSISLGLIDSGYKEPNIPNLLEPTQSLRGYNIAVINAGKYPAEAKTTLENWGSTVDLVNIADITVALLSNYHCVWMPTESSMDVDDGGKDDEILDYVGQGGGLIFTQPNNPVGPYTPPCLPYPFEILGGGYGSPCAATIEDPTHDLTNGLTIHDMPDCYDRIGTVSPQYTILSLSDDGDPGLSCAEYGKGKVIVIMDAPLGPGTDICGDNPCLSEDMVMRMFDWAHKSKSVEVPRNIDINRPLLQFLQNHPNLFPLLQKLIQQLGFGL